MIPLYTQVYPLKAQDQYEAAQLRGQGLPVPLAGKMSQWGPWMQQGNRVGERSLGGLLPIIAGGYAIYWGCKNGHLPPELCNDVAITPGTAMPGACPDVYQVEGKCFCPTGSTTPDGGCAYPGAYTVDKDGALPIGGPVTPPGPAAEDKWLLAAAGLGVVVAAVLVFSPRKNKRLPSWAIAS
jgi:hypothetical protein